MKLAEVAVGPLLSEGTLESACKMARDACLLAYAPYSKYRVGAALLCADGTLVTGCNVENASYGLTICAERTAIVNAVSSGKVGPFPMIAICALDGSAEAAPCGACRQFLVEFNANMLVVSVPATETETKTTGHFTCWRVSDLLPAHFGPQSLASK